MSRSTRIKEAIKTGQAMAVVWRVARRRRRMNMYRAAFSVAMISLPTQGQLVNQGLQRILAPVAGVTTLLARGGTSCI